MATAKADETKKDAKASEDKEPLKVEDAKSENTSKDSDIEPKDSDNVTGPEPESKPELKADETKKDAKSAKTAFLEKSTPMYMSLNANTAKTHVRGNVTIIKDHSKRREVIATIPGSGKIRGFINK